MSASEMNIPKAYSTDEARGIREVIEYLIESACADMREARMISHLETVTAERELYLVNRVLYVYEDAFEKSRLDSLQMRINDNLVFIKE